MTLPITGDWLARRAQLTPDRVALIDTLHGDRAITYRAWNAAADQTAHLLRALGVGRGDRVAVLASNCVEYLDLWFACGKLGAVLQTLNWRLAAPELAALVADGTPTALVYGPEFADTVRALRAALPPVGAQRAVPLQGEGPRAWVALDAAGRADPSDRLFAERAGYPATPGPAVEVRAADPWVICYTGGTTGLPKGAVLTHGSITWNAINTVVSWGLTPADRTMLNAPLFHTGGLNVFTAPLVQIGGTSIVCRGFDPAQVFDLIEHGGVTIWFGVPTMFIALQNHPRWAGADFRGLRWLISGGAPCPLPVFEAFWARGVEFKTGYGLTEAGPNNFWLPAAEVQQKPGAVGYPLFQVEARVVRPDGQPCAADEVGELILRGPHLCAGYWERPAETARAFVDGWLHTGDLARRDADGAYTIAGRLKDMIISGGENIYPAEVESVLAAHPAVAAVALIGVPDAHWGEVGRAIVVRRDGQAVTPEELIAFAQARLARYKVPRRVVFAATLPLTGAGKVDKARLLAEHGE